MAEEKSTALTFSDALYNKLDTVQMALPKDFNKTRFVQNAIAVLNDNPTLANANRNQVMAGLMKGAYLGLDFMHKECYLIQYGNSINFQTDYKGEIKFAKRYSIRPIKDIYAKIVREGDEFEEVIENGQPTISFKPIPFSDANIVGAFAVAQFEDGGMLYETMSFNAIQNVRKKFSKAANSKAWQDAFDEMAKKTVFRRLCKHIDCDFESVEAHQAWEEGGDAIFVNSKVVTPKRASLNDVLADDPEPAHEEIVIEAEVEE